MRQRGERGGEAGVSAAHHRADELPVVLAHVELVQVVHEAAHALALATLGLEARDGAQRAEVLEMAVAQRLVRLGLGLTSGLGLGLGLGLAN